ncbi:MAG TPA: hypothetical protein VK912_04005 [Longimicrobiales bacterium]|nr:hypothetical protein [Longimicrobiales bacterium]
MATMYCALCRRPVDARRQIGAGTIIVGVLTAGFSLLAIPFYSKRCSICKSAAVSDIDPNTVLAGASPARISDMEQRLRLTEAELDVASSELDRLRTERDFYRELLGDRAFEKPKHP